MEWSECERRKWDRTRFLATATARAMGQDVDYTEDPEDQEPDPDAFRKFLDRHRAPQEAETDGKNVGI